MRKGLATVGLLVGLFDAASCGKHATKPEHVREHDGSATATTPTLTPVAPAATAAVTREQPKLVVSVQDNPIEMHSALASLQPDGSVKLTVSSAPITCDEVDGPRVPAAGQVTFDVVVGKSLQADGSIARAVRALTFAGVTYDVLAPAPGTGDGVRGSPTVVDVALDTAKITPAPPHFVATGTIDALGCAPAPAAGIPSVPPTMPATISIAGKVWPVRDARVHTAGKQHALVLSTGADACAGAQHQLASQATVTIGDRGAGAGSGSGSTTQVSLGGAWLHELDAAIDSKQIAITPAPSAAMPLRAGTYQVKLDATVADYPVKIDGKIVVAECPE